MINVLIFPAIVAFFIHIILCPIFIPMLKKLNFGQYIRDDGPKSHLKKQGIPTMGGIVILISFLVASLFFVKGNPKGIAILVATVGYGMIGFMDDYIKVVLKRSLGLKPMQKIIGQLLVTGLFAFILMRYTDVGTEVLIPFAGTTIDLGILFLPFLFVVMIGTTNSVNLTDGLDGLASGVTVLVAAFFAVVSWGEKSGVGPITAAAVGSLLGFLLFNAYPAKVFMGDTGSLALGGFVAATAIMLKMPIFLLIVGLIYVIEALSVMIQVGYYKMTKKRIFKMAPIHHHFELSGWPESKVVAVFCIVTAMLCLVGLLAVS